MALSSRMGIEGYQVSMGLITAIFGEFDYPKKAPVDQFDECVLVTDSFRTCKEAEARGWEVFVQRYDTRNSRMAAKYPKLFPWNHLRTNTSVWIDGAFEVVSSDFRNVCEGLLNRSDIGLFRHPDGRDDAYQEAEFCLDVPKYRDCLLEEQMHSYRDAGLPENSGLWAGGVIVRRHSEVVRLVSDDWWNEMMQYGVQDQVSLPFVLWNELTPAEFDANMRTNPWLSWHSHHRED